MFKNVFLIVLLAFSITNYAQKTNLPGKLPWVNGNLPENSSYFNYKVVQGDGESLKKSQDNAVSSLLFQLASEQKINITYEAISSTQELIRNNNESSYSIDFKDKSKINSSFTAIFSKVDEYFEILDDLSGEKIYRTWQLYVVGEEAKRIIPKLNYTNKYSFSEAGYKSLLVPGWGQFHKKQNTKGFLFLVAGIGSVGSFLNANNQHNYNINRSMETSNLELKKEFVKKANDYTSIKNISLGAAIVTWIWSTIDATSTKGNTKYVINEDFKINLTNDEINAIALNIKYKF